MVNFIPSLWGRMMKFYNEYIATLPVGLRDEYLRGLRGLRLAQAGAAAASPSLVKFWRLLGKPLVVTFVSTELGGTGLQTTEDSDVDIRVSVMFTCRRA